jgi:cyanophycinase
VPRRARLVLSPDHSMLAAQGSPRRTHLRRLDIVSPSRVRDDRNRGAIVAIGGAEDKIGDEAILQRFVRLCGGRRAKLVVIPTASEARGTGRRYETLFRDLKAGEVRVLGFDSRAECEDHESLAILEKADGVFFTGGNQLRLSTTLGGTPAARTLRRMNSRGVHIAGTSAGAAFLCEHMIAFGDEGPTPRGQMVALAPGLGLTNRVILDQHFRQRDRLGRLLTALAFNPFAIGIGLDEDTAAFIGADDVIDVVGSGAITVVDPSGLEHSSLDAAKEKAPVCLIGIKLHILTDGASYDLETREATPSGAAREET